MPWIAAIRNELQISKMAQLCVGNSELEQHCSKRGVSRTENESSSLSSTCYMW